MTSSSLLVVWLLLLILCPRGESFSKPDPYHCRRNGSLGQGSNGNNDNPASRHIEVEPRGEFRDIDLSRETQIRDQLQDPQIPKTVQQALVKQVQANPQSYAPFLFLDVMAVMVQNKEGTLADLAKWYARMMVRTRVDLVMSRDRTLADVPDILSMHFGEILEAFFLGHVNEEEFFKVYQPAFYDALEWEKRTERHYDRRWVSVHSAHGMVAGLSAEDDAQLHYLDQDKLPEIQKDLEATAAQGCWLDVLEKWAKTTGNSSIHFSTGALLLHAQG